MNYTALLTQVKSNLPMVSDAALVSLKLLILEQSSSSPSIALTPQQVREILEAAVQLSATNKNRESLERHLVLLEPTLSIEQEPEKFDEYVALHLLLLLVESRLSDFFTLLESKVPPEYLKTTTRKHIAFVLGLERNLTEGSYHKIERRAATSPLFDFLLQDLEHTVREEIASCVEVSYSKISLARCADLLLLPSAAEAKAFVREREGEGWSVNEQKGEVVCPAAAAGAAHKTSLTKEAIPADYTIRECFAMATELDRIV